MNSCNVICPLTANDNVTNTLTILLLTWQILTIVQYRKKINLKKKFWLPKKLINSSLSLIIFIVVFSPTLPFMLQQQPRCSRRNTTLIRPLTAQKLIFLESSFHTWSESLPFFIKIIFTPQNLGLNFRINHEISIFTLLSFQILSI